MIKTIRNVMIVVPVLMTSCHVSEKLKIGPVTSQTITITQATINAAGLPEALVIFVAILSKKYRKVFLFTVFVAISCLFIRCSFYGLKVEKLRPNNFLISQMNKTMWHFCKLRICSFTLIFAPA